MDKTILLSYMPDYYNTSGIIDNLNSSNSVELNQLNTNIESVLDQFFVNTADFTLARWEKNFGIEVNNNYDINYRRTKLLSKIRGHGTVTINFVKNLAESFSYGDVEVLENNTAYSFSIKFVSTKGLPPNIDDLKNSLEEIKPAHLAIIYEYNYNTYEELSAFKYNTLIAYTYENLRSGNISSSFSHELLSSFTHERLGVFLNG